MRSVVVLWMSDWREALVNVTYDIFCAVKIFLLLITFMNVIVPGISE